MNKILLIVLVLVLALWFYSSRKNKEEAVENAIKIIAAEQKKRPGVI